MREFFKGWKRKIGVVMLVMACVLAAGWVRSLAVWENIDFEVFGKHIIASSELGEIQLSVQERLRNVRPIRPDWQTYTATPAEPKGVFIDHEERAMPIRVEQRVNMGTAFKLKVICITASYWLLVVPLTLLSAYLLLSKPRAPAHKTIEPVPTTGT